MDKLAGLARYTNKCPFLGRTNTPALRTLCTSTSPGFPAISQLTERATGCPVMGPALTTRSVQQVAWYASVAGNADVQRIHQSKGIFPGAPASMADIGKCPHASAAREAARTAEALAAAAAATKKKEQEAIAAHAAAAASKGAAPAGCPFHKPAETSKATATSVPKGFNYDHFYDAELEKKHKDQSYRYFNNINRLAQKFPIAHTAKVTDEVEVWCANDYLGMGGNPVVVETTQ